MGKYDEKDEPTLLYERIELEKLLGKLVGTLYPGIVRGEIAEINLRPWDLKEQGDG